MLFRSPGPSLLGPLTRGDWRPVWRGALAGLTCGLLWELWNWGSLGRWVYAVPYVDGLRLFAMPALGYAGYLYSLDYARQRPQGRPLTNKDPSSAPVPIIEHPDVRRMLLAQKSYVEGGLALGLYCARLVDEQNAGESEATRREATKLLDLLTPIVKSWPSEFCLEANKLAIQCLGGYGYTREYPVERL